MRTDDGSDDWWAEAEPDDRGPHDPDADDCMCLECEQRDERRYGEGW